MTFGKIINDAFENRSDSDYGVFVEFSEKDVATMLKDMQLFIKELERHIMDWLYELGRIWWIWSELQFINIFFIS